MFNNSSTGYIIGGFIGCIIMGFVTKYINESKGYKGGFAWGFWLNIIGIIVVACKPDNRANAPQKVSKPCPYDTPIAESYIQERIETANHMFAENNFDSAMKTYQTVLRYYSYALDDTTIDDINKQIEYCCNKLDLDYNAEKVLVESNMTKSSETIHGSDEITSSSSKQINLIKQLAELNSQGILSDEEFEEKKKEILAKI